MDCPLYSPVPLDCWSKNRPLFCFRGDLQSSKSWHLTYCLFPCCSVCLPAGKACQRRKGTYSCMALCLDLGKIVCFCVNTEIFSTFVLKGKFQPKISLRNHMLIFFFSVLTTNHPTHDLSFQGNVTFTCSDAQLVSATFLSSSSSFLSLPLDAATETLSVTFQFRTWNREGMLLSAWLSRESERLLLLLIHGQLRFTHHRSALQSSDIVIGETSTSVNVHFWSSTSGIWTYNLPVVIFIHLFKKHKIMLQLKTQYPKK